MEPVLELRGVTVRYPSRPADAPPALHEASLAVGAGEQVALVGPSGAGKTTLLSLLNGAIAPGEGEVRLFGRTLGTLAGAPRRALRRRVGTVHQRLHLVEQLRVVHNVNAGHLGRWSTAKALLSLAWPREVPRAAAALDAVGIRELLWARTASLSGGQQQRVAIARLLVQDPDVILADEPVSSLDPERSREVLELFVRLARERGKTLVASLHSLDLARSRFARLVGLRAGRIVFDAPAAAVTPSDIAALYHIERAAHGVPADGTGQRAAP